MDVVSENVAISHFLDGDTYEETLKHVYGAKLQLFLSELVHICYTIKSLEQTFYNYFEELKFYQARFRIYLECLLEETGDADILPDVLEFDSLLRENIMQLSVAYPIYSMSVRTAMQDLCIQIDETLNVAKDIIRGC